MGKFFRVGERGPRGICAHLPASRGLRIHSFNWGGGVAPPEFKIQAGVARRTAHPPRPAPPWGIPPPPQQANCQGPTHPPPQPPKTAQQSPAGAPSPPPVERPPLHRSAVAWGGWPWCGRWPPRRGTRLRPHPSLPPPVARTRRLCAHALGGGDGSNPPPTPLLRAARHVG